jgi:tetratricopeptide (TPR) repeat protein
MEIQNETSRTLLHTVCLLPHEYPKTRLADFSGLSHSQIDAAWTDPTLWRLLACRDETNQSPWPLHATCRDHVLAALKNHPQLRQERLEIITAHYQSLIGDDLDRPDIDEDALIHATMLVYQTGTPESFVLVVDRLFPIKRRYGLLDACIDDLTLAIESAKNIENKGLIAALSGNLGLIYYTRGDLDQAETMFKKSLDISEELGNKLWMANQYGNLGNLYYTKDDLDKAETMYLKSIKIEEALGHEEGRAVDYCNLGSLHYIRGNLKQAEVMYQKSLEIYKALGRKEGMASVYGNLGNIYWSGGDMDQAETMFKKSLEINQALRRKEGMANQYGNLGNLYYTKGDMEQAETMYRESLSLFKQIGATPMVEKTQALLDELLKQKKSSE